MARKTAAQKSNLASLNIVAGCKVQVINQDTWKYQTIAEPLYTPAAINAVMKKHKLQSAWVYWLGGRELWFSTKGKLAKKDNGK